MAETNVPNEITAAAIAEGRKLMDEPSSLRCSSMDELRNEVEAEGLTYIEADPLPAPCQNCSEPDCDVCDYGLDRWRLPPETRAELRRKLGAKKQI